MTLKWQPARVVTINYQSLTERRQLQTNRLLALLKKIAVLAATQKQMEESMSEHYHDAGDLKFFKEMSKLAPTEFNAWLNLDKVVGRDEGAIPRKYRELIALAVAFTTQCVYCIEAHVKAAKATGASREEITESAFIAAALRAGGAATHGAMALKFYDQV
jgi:AhpD family alkylhydroperoxidase